MREDCSWYYVEENLLHEKIEIIVEKSSKKAKQVSFIREFRVHGNMTFKLLIKVASK